MKQLAITFFAITAFTVGCKPSAEQDRKATAGQFDKAIMATKEAAQETKDYTYAQKTQFVEKMQSQMAGINRDLDQLMARIEKSTDAAKAEAKPRLQALRDQASKLNHQLDEARDATESTWDGVKGGFKKSYGELKEGFQNARQWVSEALGAGGNEPQARAGTPGRWQRRRRSRPQVDGRQKFCAVRLYEERIES